MNRISPHKAAEVLHGLASLADTSKLLEADISVTLMEGEYAVTSTSKFVGGEAIVGDESPMVSRALYILLLVCAEESRVGLTAGTMRGSGVQVGKFWRSDEAHVKALEYLKEKQLLQVMREGQVSSTAAGRRVCQSATSAANLEISKL